MEYLLWFYSFFVLMPLFYLYGMNHKKIREHEYFKDREMMFFWAYLRIIYSNPNKYPGAPSELLEHFAKGRKIMKALLIAVVVAYLVLPAIFSFYPN